MNRLSCCVALYCMIGIVCFSAEAQDTTSPSRSRFIRWAFDDGFALLGEADRRTPLRAAGVGILLLPVTLYDDEINPAVKKWNRGRFGEYLNFVNEWGGPRATVPVATLFAFSLFTKDTRLQDASFTAIQSLFYAGGIAYALKFTIGRVRPEETDAVYHFLPFSGHTSFPSGHTTTVFAVLTPFVLYYPHPLTYGFFAIATGTALARLAENRHWASDVLAGGTLGVVMAYWLTRRHQSVQSQWDVKPTMGANNAIGLRLTIGL